MKYQIPQELLQVIVNILGELPFSRVHTVMKAIEQECTLQDQQHAAKSAADAKEALKAELAAGVHKS